MKIVNTSARLVHFNVPGGPVTVAPLGSVTLTGEQETAAKVLLAGVWKPLVDDGSLVIDGARLQPTAAPPVVGPQPGASPISSEPSSAPSGDPPLPPSAAAPAPASPSASLPPKAADVDNDPPTGAKRGKG